MSGRAFPVGTRTVRQIVVHVGMLPFLVTVAEILLYKNPFAVLTTCKVAGAVETENGTVNA
nr:hypothetical protein [uncultured Agathobaculum sp.]